MTPFATEFAVAAPVQEVEETLKAALSVEEYAMLRVSQRPPRGSSFRTPPLGEFSAIETVVAFVGSSIASGLTWDLLKKAFGALERRYNRPDDNKPNDRDGSDDKKQ